MHERSVQIIATETGQSVETVRKDTDRNYWMSAAEAIEYGVANKIINSDQRYQTAVQGATSSSRSGACGCCPRYNFEPGH